MHLVVALHSHLPLVLNHGRWPHGSDWLCEAAVDTYLPLLEQLRALELEQVPSPVTLGITPILANQLSHPGFLRELGAFFTQRLAACDEAIAAFEASGETTLIPKAEFWRGRFARLWRLFERIDGDLNGAFRHHEAAGRIEIMSSAATHGFLPLLARDESIRLQLWLGRAEHHRLFGGAPAGCWVPECAYRPRGPWGPHPDAPAVGDRAGVDEFLGEAHYRYFFTDSHLAQAGRTLGLYREPEVPDGPLLAADDPLDLPAARSPYRAYQVSPRRHRPVVTTLVRDPRSSRQVWSRYQGYPGDGVYLEFHKIRFPGGLKLWRVTLPTVDLGAKDPYDPNTARARAHRHAAHYAGLMREIAETEGAAGGELIVAPFDTELFGHWWFEGVDFLGDLYRALARRAPPTPMTASAHLGRRPAGAAVELAEGSWGANGDFSKWLNPDTEWTWVRLWQLEQRFWNTVPRALPTPAAHQVLAQAARELVLAQASDWQFIVSSATAADYATRRFTEHVDGCHRLLDGIDGEGPALAGAQVEADRLGRVNGVFPNVLATVAAAAGATSMIPAV